MPLAILLALFAPSSLACPEAVLGTGTSTAVLKEAVLSAQPPWVLHLELEVTDAPRTQTIEVDGERIEASVEHATPLSLAAWARHLTLDFGGSSKFVMGGLRSTTTGDLALIPFSALRGLSIAQGEDFDEDAPFQVSVDLVLLNRPEPFVGTRGPVVPPPDPVVIDGARFERIPLAEGGDPYGTTYGDWFGDPDLVASFVHGPHSSQQAGKPGAPGPWRSSPAVGAGLGPGGDLYEFVSAIYGSLQPTASISDLVGDEVVLALAADRTFDPPASPWTD